NCEIVQSEAQVKKPGESMRISCSTSGFSFTSYWRYWIRQAPGKGLEWIGEINSGSIYYSQCLQRQFTLTNDTSKNTVYLQGKGLGAEDTAVYHCVEESH
ncbi:HV146 protein, partial [Atractosteus spatula]|nr:HV146 protein [Atractosteus spatula]